MSVALLSFVLLVACASAQCSFEGKAFTTGGEDSLAFGAAVAGAVPLVFFTKSVYGEDQSYLSTWTPSGSRVDVQDHGTVGRVGACDGVGHYKVSFSQDCNTLTLTLLSDSCDERSSVYTSSTWTVYSIAIGTGNCRTYSGTLNPSEMSPRLGGEVVTISTASNGIMIQSVGDVAIIFQRWDQGVEDHQVNVRDIMSVPDGYACHERHYGQYIQTFQRGSFTCGVAMCGKAETCPERASLFDGTKYNGYSGAVCGATAELIIPNAACSDGTPWRRSPQECTSRNSGSQCMYCHGVANNKDVKLCLERDDAACNDIFRSVWAKSWCNLEFECPASTLSFSFFALLVVLMAVLF